MKVELQDSFIKKLNRQVAFIALDKPQAARNFKQDLLHQISKIAEAPYSYIQSAYFNDSNSRHLIFKGYTIVFRIYPKKDVILIFGLIKYQHLPKS
jgi:plasmid stabilization system protein ParE